MSPQTRARSKLARALRCALAVALVGMLAIPVLAPTKLAMAESSINSASNLTWDELKPHLEEGLGVPYLFGGASKAGWDCSGYASWVFNTFGATNYTHYTVAFEQELASKGCFVMEGNANNLRDERMQPGDIIFFYSEGVDRCTHMGIVGDRVDGIVMVYHAFTNSFADIYGHRGTMLQGLDANPGSSLRGIWYMSSGHGKGNWSKFTVYRGVVSTGSLSLYKHTANASITDDNANYSLEGATYGVYASEGDAYAYRNPVATMTCDANGYAYHEELNQGRYFVREISPSPGYALDENVYETTVTGGQNTDCNVYEKPQANPLAIWLAKNDSETGASSAQGDATLAKAQFTFTFYGGQYDSLEAAEQARESGVASRSWTLQTDERGAIDFTDANATFALHDDAGSVTDTAPYFVEGDPLYTDSDGNIVLPLGTVFVEEAQAPEGYLVNADLLGPIHISSSGTSATISCYNNPIVSDQVMRGGVVVGKVDRETREHKPLGSATLEGAVFAVQNSSPSPVLVNGSTYLPGQTVMTLTTDAQGIAQSADDALPYGTYTVTEVEAPRGYALDETSQAWSRTVRIRDQHQVVDFTSPDDSVSDQVKRGDISFSKVHGQTMERMANVAFSVTSMTTGETHVILTDENGMVDTSASWNAHSNLTNANDFLLDEASELDDPVAQPNDGAGSSAVAEQTPLAPESAGSTQGDDPTEEEQTDIAKSANRTAGPTGSASETDEAKDADANADASAQTSDEQAVRPADEDRASAQKGAPEASEGTAAQQADPSAGIWFNGTNTATTEPNDLLGALPYDTYRIVELPGESNAGMAMAEFTVTISRDHVDLDLGTVDNLAASSIHTTLTDEHGQHLAQAQGQIVLTDAVEYDNLVPGKTYTLSGTLHRVGTDGEGTKFDAGELCDSNGDAVHAERTFVADMAHGSIPLEFALDASQLRGTTLVAFESLSCDDKEVAVHADAADEDQTVYFPAIETILNAAPSSEVTSAGTCMLVDTVSFSNLQPGKTYEMAAALHLRDAEGNDAGAATDANGNPITARQSFTPESSSGSVDVAFAFNAPSLAGSTVVAFEELVRNGVTYTAHADINDEAQSASMPFIATSAHDANDGDRTVDAASSAQIRDQVTFGNLNPAKTYRMVATVHIASKNDDGSVCDNGALCDEEGNKITAEKQFSPEQTEGTIDVDLDFSTERLAGSTVVVFEECYCGSTLVAQHADISDEGQSIVVLAPENPKEKPRTYDNPNGTFAKTGNPLIDFGWVPFALLAIGAATGAIAFKNARKPHDAQRRRPHPRRP